MKVSQEFKRLASLNLFVKIHLCTQLPPPSPHNRLTNMKSKSEYSSLLCQLHDFFRLVTWYLEGISLQRFFKVKKKSINDKPVIVEL